MFTNKQLILILFILVIPFFSWCQSKTPIIISATLKPKLDSVIALLNDSAWHGKARILRLEESKKLSRVDANFLTYSPYTTYSSHGEIIDTMTQLVPNQWLNINNMPLTVGMYKLSALNNGQSLKIRVRYDLFEGGDAISNSYFLKRDDDNWIRITKYDSKTGVLTGAFELKLIGRSGEIAHFKNGIFKAKILEREK
jgi:hypothetical protein